MPVDKLNKAVILCAGKGERLLPLTAYLPKVMVEVEGKPILERHLEWVRSHGIGEVFINLHHLADVIREHFGSGADYGVRITYSEESRLRGTAGSLRGFRDALDEPFLLHYGDVYAELDIARLFAHHRRREAAATLVVHPSTHPRDSDAVVVDGEGRIVELGRDLARDGDRNLYNAACYLLEPRVLHYVDEGESRLDFIRDVFPRMIAAGERLYGYDTDELLLDMGTPERYAKLIEILGS